MQRFSKLPSDSDMLQSQHTACYRGYAYYFLYPP